MATPVAGRRPPSSLRRLPPDAGRRRRGAGLRRRRTGPAGRGAGVAGGAGGGAQRGRAAGPWPGCRPCRWAGLRRAGRARPERRRALPGRFCRVGAGFDRGLRGRRARPGRTGLPHVDRTARSDAQCDHAAGRPAGRTDEWAGDDERRRPGHAVVVPRQQLAPSGEYRFACRPPHRCWSVARTQRGQFADARSGVEQQVG